MSKPEPIVAEIELAKHFRFMYSNFVMSSQQTLYLMLSRSEENIDVLEFDFSLYKYGCPNDEVGHPLMKHGLGFYGFFEVYNSPWIEEIRLNNSSHPSHSNSIFSNRRHFIAKFKDLTLEIIANNYELKSLSKEFFKDFLDEQFKHLDND